MGAISLCQGKDSKSAAQEAIFTQPEGEFRFIDRHEEGRPAATWAASMNIYLYNNQHKTYKIYVAMNYICATESE